MKIHNEDEDEKIAYQFPEYEKGELLSLEKEMNEKYKIIKTYEGKEFILYNEEQWFKDNGGMNKDGKIIVTGFCQKTNWKANPPYQYSWCEYPSKFEILRDKLWKMYNIQKKREYAIRKSIKEFERQIKVANIDPVENY